MQQQSIWLSLGGGQVRVLESRPASGSEQTPPRLSGRVLHYQLLGEAGVIASGSVEDPREVMVEWSEDGVALQNAVASRTDPMVRIDLPAVDGELLLRDDSGFIGSTWLTVEPPSPQRLGSLRAEIAPVLVSGGGDTATALDVLFLPDGYTAGELAQFAADIDNHLNVLFANPDWGAYRGSINLGRLDVPSNQSGIGEAGVPGDTAFGVARSTTIRAHRRQRRRRRRLRHRRHRSGHRHRRFVRVQLRRVRVHGGPVPRGLAVPGRRLPPRGRDLLRLERRRPS